MIKLFIIPDPVWAVAFGLNNLPVVAGLVQSRSGKFKWIEYIIDKMFRLLL